MQQAPAIKPGNLHYSRRPIATGRRLYMPAIHMAAPL